VAATQRIEQLLHKMREQGYWTAEEVREIYEMTGRDAGYIPEGCEDWMQEDGVPRSYDKPPLKLDQPPSRPAEPAELAKAEKARIESKMLTWPPPDIEDRLKTIETTLTDLYRRLKALEERVIDPSV
jgi:hypothetical protein